MTESSTSERRERVKEEKRNFVSPNGLVINYESSDLLCTGHNLVPRVLLRECRKTRDPGNEVDVTTEMVIFSHVKTTCYFHV